MIDKEKRNQHEKQHLIETVLGRSVQKGRTIEFPSIGSITNHGAGSSIVINIYNSHELSKSPVTPDTIPV